MNHRYLNLTLLIAFLSFQLKAQEVFTLSNDIPSRGGIAVASNGTVYISDESDVIYFLDEKGEKKIFIKDSKDITRATILAYGPNSGETLFVSNTPLDQLGSIVKVAPDGSTSIFSSGIALPTGLAFDDIGNLFVADHFNKIWKINSNGDKVVFVESELFNRPHGMAWAGGNLYVASAHDGSIYRLDTSGTIQPKVEKFAYVDGLKQPWACGHMVYSKGALYITNGDDIVHRISMNGEVTDFAGSGMKGSKDGASDVAEFTAPNGIAVNEEGTMMYVGEYTESRLRVIKMK